MRLRFDKLRRIQRSMKIQCSTATIKTATDFTNYTDMIFVKSVKSVAVFLFLKQPHAPAAHAVMCEKIFNL